MHPSSYRVCMTALLTLCAAMALPPLLSGAESDGRGLRRSLVVTAAGPPVSPQDSHALVIGCTAYAAWPRIPGAVVDVRAVGAALAKQGFMVRSLIDPSLVELRNGLESFILEQGLQPDRRLVIYFAGHGHTAELADGRHMGYLVPVDAPDPTQQPLAFRARALDLRSLIGFAERIESRHALFVFDACFSGSFFALRAAVEPGPDTVRARSRPVRHFISSGSAGERVPDQSVFRRLFIRGIEGDADLGGDGLVTGSELGVWLFTQTVQETRDNQHPQSGKIQNPDLNQGEIIFAPGRGSAATEASGRSFSVPGAVQASQVMPAGPGGSPRPLGQTASGGLQEMVRLADRREPGEELPPPAPIDPVQRMCLVFRDGRELTGDYDPLRQTLTQEMAGSRIILHVHPLDVRRWLVPAPRSGVPGSEVARPGGAAIMDDFGNTVVSASDPSWSGFKPRIRFLAAGRTCDRVLMQTKTLPLSHDLMESLTSVGNGSPGGWACDGDPETVWTRGNGVDAALTATFVRPQVCRGLLIRTGPDRIWQLELASITINGGEPIPIIPDATVSSQQPPRLEGNAVIMISFGGRRELAAFRLALVRAESGFGIREIALLK